MIGFSETAAGGGRVVCREKRGAEGFGRLDRSSGFFESAFAITGS